MHYYHDGYQNAHAAAGDPEDLRTRDRREQDDTYEPITVPAILNWLLVVSFALCVIFTTIQALS